MADCKKHIHSDQQSFSGYASENMPWVGRNPISVFATEEDGNIITLTAEQQHVIDRWNVMPADKQRVFSELLDMLSNEYN